MTTVRKQPSTDARRAIWEAWNRRCAYTGEPIDWSQLHVDHIIPVERPDILERLQISGLVSRDFDINGFENLLPALSFQNLSKLSRELQESRLLFFIDKAEDKKAAIEAALSRLIKSNYELKAYLAIKSASERNDVSMGDMVEFYAHKFEGSVPLRISPGIQGTSIASANSSFAAALMDKPFALGDGTVDEVVLRNNRDEFVYCKTSNELIGALDDGCYAYTTVEIKIASMALETTQALRAIRDSAFAENSDLRSPRVTLKDTARWSADWVLQGIVDRREEIEALGLRTIADAVAAGICEVESLSEYAADFIVPGGLDVTMRECMRADLDGDGWEEILVFHYISAARSGGTLGAGDAVMAKVEGSGFLHMRPYPATDQ